MAWSRTLISSVLSATAAMPALGQDIPTCALSGSTSVMIGGKPALRLSDVARCPPELYEVISSIMIEGQPMVHFKSGASGKTTCAAKGDKTVTAESNDVQTLGDVSCRTTE